MSIFKKKKEKIEIIVPLENNVSAREFARVHAEPNTSIEVEVHGGLWKSDGRNLVSVIFTPERNREEIALDFMEEFKGREPVVGRRLMFCN